MKKLSDSELLAKIASRKANGLNAEGGQLTNFRQKIFNEYLGRPYGNEKAGLSSVVSRDVLETVEWAMPSLMRIFAGDDLIVSFEPTGADDEQAARQETEYINYIFKKENDGFLVLHNFVKDALLSPTAYAKVWHEESEEITTEEYKGLLPQDLAILEADPELEAIEQGYDDIDGTYDVVYKRTHTTGRKFVESVPPEELIIDEKLSGLDLSRADFIIHSTDKSKDDLIEMGYKKSVVEGLSSPDTNEYNAEKYNRRDSSDEDNQDSNDGMLLYEEAYIIVEGERRKICFVGSTILENEPDDYIPFIAMSSVLIPHRHTGMAFAELVSDLQRIKTTLTRQLLNNMYRVNNPRPIVGPGVNMADLLNDAPNAPIRARDIGDMRMEPTQPIVGQVLPVMQHFDEVRASRSGVSANTMGVAPEALAETTRGAYLGNLEQANQRLEMIARLFAETGIKQIFLKLHELTLRYQKDVVDFKLNGEWVQVNPTEWKTRRNMSVVVGIGYGTKEQQLMALGQVQIAQEKLAMAGSPLVSPQNIYNLQAKQAELANTGDPEKYFSDPSKMSPEQLSPPPPPNQLAEAEMAMAQVEAKKVELEHQRKTFELEQKVSELEGKLIVELTRLEQGDRKLDNEEAKIILDSEAKEAQLEQSRQRELNQAQGEVFNQ